MTRQEEDQDFQIREGTALLSKGCLQLAVQIYIAIIVITTLTWRKN